MKGQIVKYLQPILLFGIFIIMTMGHFINISIGVSPEMPFEEAIRTRMVNIFAMLASIASFSYLFVYDGLFFYLNVIFLLGFSTTLIFNKIGWIYFAKLWLYTVSHITLFISASAFGRGAGEQMILLPVLFGGVLVIHSRESWSLTYAIALTVMTFIVLEVTNYSLFSLPISPETQLTYYYSNLVITIVSSIVAAVLYFRLYRRQLEKTETTLSISREIEDTINYFSTSLMSHNSEDDILKDVAQNCIHRLGIEDSMVYLLDETRMILVQKVAYFDKKPQPIDFENSPNIPFGKGLVGYVAMTGEPLRVSDATIAPRYLKNRRFRYSLLAIPMVYNNKVIGVIDSGHSEKNFFTTRHERILQTIAGLCANKLAHVWAAEEQEKTRHLRIEAEKIKALDELKTRLLTNLSHELRTPLTLIMGTIEKNIRAPAASDWIILKSHTNRLLRLINQLMDLTRLESGHFHIKPKPNDISSFFKRAVALFETMATSRNASIELHGTEEALFLNFDQDALEKIFYNILSNAVKFTREGTTVEMRVSYADNTLFVQVSDHGPGILETDHDKIFDRFYQSSLDQSGTGIGLAITRELVELHKGLISIKSAKDQGSTFFVEIPLSPAERSEKDFTPIKTTPQKKETDKNTLDNKKQLILVIEDNNEVAEMLRELLEEFYQVCVAGDGNMGIQTAEKLVPDLIISDIMMPGTDGLILCNTLKNTPLTNHIPIILLTARDDMESKLNGLHIGADDYIVKPFHADELLSRVENLLRQRILLQEKYKKIIELQPSEITITSDEEVFIHKLIKVVEQNFEVTKFGVGQLAEEMLMSRMQLHRKTKVLIGKSPNEFIRDLRLQRAAQYLSQGKMVSQTAYSVGYSSLSNFSKIFKEKFGVLPSDYNA